MADLSTMSDADLEAIANPAPHPALASMSDEDLHKIATQGAPLANAPTDTTGTSMLKGAGTAVIKGLGHIPGFAGDLRDMTDYIVQRAHSAISGVSMEELQKRRAETQAKVSAGAPSWATAIPSIPSGADISDPVLARTGEYHPTTGPGRMLMAGTEAGTSMLGPGGVMAGMRAAREALPALQIARRALTGAPKAIPGGVVAGGAGDLATQATGDPLAGMVAGVAVPVAGSAAMTPVRNFVTPIMPGNRAALASRKLQETATNPEKAVADLEFQPREILPGAEPTTGQVTGDIGLLQAEKRARTEDPSGFGGEMLQREGAQNTARVGELNHMAPEADVMSPGKLFQQHLANIENDAQARIDAAMKSPAAATVPPIPAATAENATRLTREIPGTVPPEAAGAQLRDVLAAEAEKSRAARARLYKAVDPDGKLAVVTSGARTAALTMAEGIDPSVTIPSKIAAPVIEMVGKLQDVTPFNKLTDLDATISAKMAEAKQAGDYTGHAQLVQMKQAVQSDIHNAIENQAKWQERAVKQGVLKQEDTVGAALAKQAAEFQTNRKAGSGAEARAGNSVRTERAPGVSGVRRESGETERGPQNAPGNSGIPGNEPNFDPEAAARLAAAKAAHADYAQTYRQGPVGTALKDTGFKEQYRVPDSGIPASALPSGDKGYTATSAFLKAAKNDPAAVAAIQDMAVNKLRDTMKNGELTPAGLAAWKKSYGNSLRAIDEASPGFSRRFDSAASATQELAHSIKLREERIANLQKGDAKALLDLQRGKKAAVSEFESSPAGQIASRTAPSEVVRDVGQLLAAKDGPTQISALVDAAKDNPSALAGLRRAGMEHIRDKFFNVAKAGPEHVLSPRLMSYLEKNGEALEALYGKEGLQNMHRVAADMDRSQTAFDLQKVKGGSDTGANVAPMFKMLAKAGAHGSALTAVALATMEAAERGGPWAGLGVAATYPIALMANKLRAHGIEKINDLYERGLLDPDVGKAMLQRGIDENGKLNTAAFNNLVRALSRSSAMNQTYQQDSRVGRASGGKVAKMDYAAKAAELIKMAERAKKAHGRQTRSLLALPDSTVATALKLANQAS